MLPTGRPTSKEVRNAKTDQFPAKAITLDENCIK
jgi:hypothetical protein